MRKPITKLLAGEAVPELAYQELVERLQDYAESVDQDDDEELAKLLYGASNAIIKLSGYPESNEG